jgi:hypothetical protein
MVAHRRAALPYADKKAHANQGGFQMLSVYPYLPNIPRLRGIMMNDTKTYPLCRYPF